MRRIPRTGPSRDYGGEVHFWAFVTATSWSDPKANSEPPV